MLRLTIILGIACSVITLAAKLDVVYEWKYINYLWESKEQKNAVISKNGYDHQRIFPYDVQKVKDGRVFVTTPQYYPDAVPARLSTVSKEKCPGGPLLKPYPNWEWHNSKNCSSIINVWRVYVDNCDRLWVLDNGVVAQTTQVCPAKFLVFDLKTDKLLQKIEIPDDISHSPGNNTLRGLIGLIVETNGTNCEQTWVYATDFFGGGIVVYDGSKLWRRDDDVFHPYPSTTDISIAGEQFTLSNGPLGMALTPDSPSRRLFFKAATSARQNSVSVDDLHKLDADDDICSTTSKYRLPGIPSAQAISRDGIMLFGLFTETAIGCWNSSTPLNAENVDIVTQNNETLQWISSMKIIECSDDPSREEVWVFSNRFYKFLTGTINFEETNFRVFRAVVDTLLKHSKCEVQSSGKSSESHHSRYSLLDIISELFTL